ncbi:helix-turn-helix domain-containing protein [Paenibacillus sp. PsM32]|uniref:PucR family transcriptional regulator n=1 Tax=Paenibacillus sp. PsM32 TaxID=3030536 RepID=UPI00263B1D63|nr:helix-turn-helix domain-containing protein [Paenibacillus sp. PsM32]MDN4619849.1 helix-turn-helix domain-containing protein [Paenibacillus sp. PsM32]
MIPKINEMDIDNLQTLVEKISEVMETPVTIEDAEHRLLAYSSHDPNSDPARIATIVGRKVPEDVVRALYESGAMQQLLDTWEPVHVEGMSQVGLNNRMAIAIRHYDEVLGYIWLLENKGSFTSEQIQQLKYSATLAASKMIQMQKRKQSIDFFNRLLKGRFTSEQDALAQAREVGIQMPAYSYILMIEQDGNHDNNDWLDKAIQAATEYAVRIVLHLREPHRLILLCSTAKTASSVAPVEHTIVPLVNRLSTLLPSSPIEYGAGSVVSSVLAISRSYTEAQYLLMLHHRLPETNSILYYPQAGFYRYLYAMKQEAVQFPAYTSPLDKLAAYDQEHHSHLLHTLAVFLDHNSDAKLAAGQLHVHTNTLNYRLKRIAEVGQIDLNNMAQKVTLYLEIKLLLLEESE